MSFVFGFPEIDPIAVQIGPLAIRWYALAYIAGILLGWRYMRAITHQSLGIADTDTIDDFLTWATLGVVLGGRLGYVFFYKPGFYLSNPIEIIQVWHGGMSFHGGLIGVGIAAFFFARRHNINLIKFTDVLACVAPIGLFFGRLANFINGELFGRASDVPWAMVFPNGGPDPRHPSQIYEALLEGLVLFVVLDALRRFKLVRLGSGSLTGMFLLGYALARSLAELFRQPDVHLGFVFAETTMGQWLSAPMAVLGVFLILRSRYLPKTNQTPTNKSTASRAGGQSGV